MSVGMKYGLASFCSSVELKLKGSIGVFTGKLDRQAHQLRKLCWICG
jgi:hypothetical protein